MNNSPIGIFDSGIGGLTVFKQVASQLPNENIIYLGDTARVPYGSRSTETIIAYSLELVHFLLKQKVKLLVIACNTISSTALKEIKKISPVPIVEVITPTVTQALSFSKTNHIGVIGTEATIRSNIYSKMLHLKKKNSYISSLACPLLVPLVEEGLLTNKGTEDIVQFYMDKLSDKRMDTLILGCTHYPLLKSLIERKISPSIKVIDSAFPTALEVKKILIKEKLLNSRNAQGKKVFFVTDDAKKAEHIAQLFFTNHPDITFKKIHL